MNFEAFLAFTHVTACPLAESPLRPSSTVGFSGFVTSTAAPIATGRNEPVPGWDLHPLWTKRLSRRTRTISVIATLQGVQASSPETCGGRHVRPARILFGCLGTLRDMLALLRGSRLCRAALVKRV